MGDFILFLLILLGLAILLRVDFFFTIFYLLAGIYILSHLWSRRMLKHLRASRRLEQRAFLGETLTVTLELENLSQLPIPWLMLTEVFPVDLAAPPLLREVVALSSKSIHTVQYQLAARKRGYYQIGPLTLQTGDLLGFRQQVTDSVPADYLIVYPRILPMSRLGLPTHSPQVVATATTPIFQDPTRLIGVRDYHPGDNPRHIHWTATAATGQILVKQFQPAIARDNVIFLNLSRPDYAQQGYPEPAIELAITVAASLANHMLTSETLPVGLCTTADDPLIGCQQRFHLPPAKGRGHLMQILEVLARVQASRADTNFLEGVRQEAVRLSWGATAIMITSHETEALVHTLLFLKRSGFQATLVVVDPPRTHQPGPRHRHRPSRNLGIPVYCIREHKDVEAWVPYL